MTALRSFRTVSIVTASSESGNRFSNEIPNLNLVDYFILLKYANSVIDTHRVCSQHDLAVCRSFIKIHIRRAGDVEMMQRQVFEEEISTKFAFKFIGQLIFIQFLMGLLAYPL